MNFDIDASGGQSYPKWSFLSLDVKIDNLRIMEADINFDGNPDFLVFLGIKETEHDKYRSFYEAFVWNAVTRQFHHVAKFKELYEPYVDPETKTIKATVAEGSSVREEIYQWKFGKLVLCEKSEP